MDDAGSPLQLESAEEGLRHQPEDPARFHGVRHQKQKGRGRTAREKPNEVDRTGRFSGSGKIETID